MPVVLWAIVQTVFMLICANQDNEFLALILSDAFMIAAGYFWLRDMKHIRYEETEAKKFTFKECVKVFILGLLLQAVIGEVLNILMKTAPDMMASYREVLESLGMYAPTLSSVFYTVILAPIAEEVIFRGMTQGILEREFPFWAANILQAACFALIHGNPVQGGYAFVSGLILGKIAKRYGTPKASVICHFAVNLSGMLIG